jgi:hypothetical protein
LVVDVGGGRSRLLATILERYPRLRGILFDEPLVIEDARQSLEEVGVVDRCELVGGSLRLVLVERYLATPSGAGRQLVADVEPQAGDIHRRSCAVSSCLR